MSYLSEKIDELRDLLEGTEDLYEDEWDDIEDDDIEEWSKWGTKHGPVKGRESKKYGIEWEKGAYEVVGDKELATGVEGHWIRVNGKPRFVVDKHAKIPKKLRDRLKKQGKVTRRGRYRPKRRRR